MTVDRRAPLPMTLADTSTPASSRLRARIRRIGQIVRMIIGAPDYDRYATHMSAHHPECALLSRDDFTRQRLEDRYSRPGSRCC